MGIPDIRQLITVEFEVYGHVQVSDSNEKGIAMSKGCYFTKFTRDLCSKAGITGWVKNSKQGTIVGKMQGPKEEVDKMTEWLSTKGSPGCQIEKCDFRNIGTLNRLDYKTFEIRF